MSRRARRTFTKEFKQQRVDLYNRGSGRISTFLYGRNKKSIERLI